MPSFDSVATILRKENVSAIAFFDVLKIFKYKLTKSKIFCNCHYFINLILLKLYN